jgi:hypothetical protein
LGIRLSRGVSSCPTDGIAKAGGQNKNVP